MLLVTLAAGCGGSAGSTVSAPRNGVTTQELDVDGGAGSIVIRAGAIGGDLYRASGIKTNVTRERGHVHVLVSGKVLDIAVSRDVQWRVRIAGGASQLVVDFSKGKLLSAQVAGGDSRVVLRLGEATGQVPVHFLAGVNRLVVHSPRGAVQIWTEAGAGQVVIDGTAASGVAAGSVLTTPGWLAALHRYAVYLHDGASSIVVDRRS